MLILPFTSAEAETTFSKLKIIKKHIYEVPSLNKDLLDSLRFVLKMNLRNY